ncbi:helix-turn-helix domain-containing protein [Microbulbifer sp. CnH-101-E]|uniref:helix-turn-helix domain-containing protein n=1 Tax=unclassified Microbulbifer TaxID=2619833 RepID=UPI004039D71E
MIYGNDRIINLAEEPGNISKDYKKLGVSRGTLYRYKKVFSTGGLDTLLVTT